MGPRHQALSYQMSGYEPFSVLTSANMKMHMFAAAKMQTINRGFCQARNTIGRAQAECISASPYRLHPSGLAASDPLAARIGAIDDVQRLKQLHRAAIQVPSLEAFSNLLDTAE